MTVHLIEENDHSFVLSRKIHAENHAVFLNYILIEVLLISVYLF